MTAVTHSRQILLLTGDAGECYEMLYARHRFLEAGMTPVIGAPSKRRLHLVILECLQSE